MGRILAVALLSFAVAFSAAAQTFVGAMSGSWWDASRPGEGQFITFETVAGRNVAYVAYFTYTADGRATWHVGNADFAADAASISVPLVTGSGARFGAGFRSADVRVDPAGTATLEFISCTRMRMRHSGMPGVALELTRLVGPLAGAGCGESPPAARNLTGVVSGSWWEAARGGEGQFITFETVGARNVAYVAYFTYTADGAATWLVGNADFAVGDRSVTIPVVTGSGARFGTAFRAADVTIASAGTVRLDLASCTSMRLIYSGSQPLALDLIRLVGPLAGLECTDAAALPEPRAREERMAQIASRHAAFTYDIQVYFPPGYSAASGNHPVIYAADGELLFADIKAAVERSGHNAIVVVVGNGGADRRFIDYVFPGATAYNRFLTLELMPFIETQYRVDRTRRTFVGYSLSGSFAGIAMLLDDPAARHFRAFVSIDGSFWNQTDMINQLEQDYANATRNLPVSLYLAAADNLPSISAFRQRMEMRGYTGLRMSMQPYSLNHSQVVPPGILDGLDFVFAP